MSLNLIRCANTRNLCRNHPDHQGRIQHSPLMPTLLHIYRRYYPDEGGIEWTMRAFCEYLARQGNDVSALVSSRDPWTVRTTVNDVNVIRCGSIGTIANTPICPMM